MRSMVFSALRCGLGGSGALPGVTMQRTASRLTRTRVALGAGALGATAAAVAAAASSEPAGAPGWFVAGDRIREHSANGRWALGADGRGTLAGAEDVSANDNLDAGYKSRTSNPLAVVRKRKALPPREGEPLYTMDQVADHANPDGPEGMWVTYKDGVYDMTQFIKVHPGGKNFLLQAAGGAVDTLWAYWHWHHCSPSVQHIMEKSRIGRLSDWEEDEVEGVDMYEADPARPDSQITLFDRPWSSQTSAETMNASYLTPADSVYVRSHAPVPLLDAATHVLTFEDPNSPQGSAKYTLTQLEERFGKKKVTSVIQCGGNRAYENLRHNGPSGFTGNNFCHIRTGMAGNVQWTGVSVAAVLEHMGCATTDADTADGYNKGKWVEFYGADGYYGSVPLAHVMDPENDCLLAVTMNDAPLPPDHGYPVRLLVPGVVGARNIKWLERIVVRDDEGDAPWNNWYYKSKSEPAMEDGTFPSSMSFPPVNSFILNMVPSARAGVRVEGVAFGNGIDGAVDAVEVSADQGKTWHSMEVREDEVLADDSSKHWHWVRWHGEVAGSSTEVRPQELWCRATTETGVGQPKVGPKRGGYFFNGYYKAKVDASKSPDYGNFGYPSVEAPALDKE